MVPQKCIERQCPRHVIHKGVDVCVLYQVSEKDENGGQEIAVLDVFNVKDKQCRRLREEVKELMEKEEINRFGQPKEIVMKPLMQQESPRD